MADLLTGIESPLHHLHDEGERYRTAVAEGRVEVDAQTIDAIRKGQTAKGDVLQTARVAALMAAKRTTELIPHALDVHLQGIDLSFDFVEDPSAVLIRAYAKSSGTTGVEMEALTAVAVAGLTIYDMCKSLTKEINITGVHLVAKTGGQSGDYRRQEPLTDRG